MATINAFFNQLFEQKASDLHMASGSPPRMRINSKLQRVDYPPLESNALKAMLYEIAPDYKVKLFEKNHDVNNNFLLQSFREVQNRGYRSTTRL